MERNDFERALVERYGKGNRMNGTGADWLMLFFSERNRPMRCRAEGEIMIDLMRDNDDIGGFLRALHHDERLRITSQAWGEFAKRENWSLPVADGARRYLVHADAGSVKIGDVGGTCGFCISNGWGDGTFAVIVAEPDQINRSWFTSTPCHVEGRFRLYGYDCDELADDAEDSMTFEGRFSVYVREGTVAFVRI